MSTSSSAPPEMSIAMLRERYRRHALTIRNLREVSVDKQAVYLDRLLDFPGPRRTSTELFAQLDRERLREFLVDY